MVFFKMEGSAKDWLVILDSSEGNGFFQCKVAIDAACNYLKLELALLFKESSLDEVIGLDHAFHYHNQYTSSAAFNK